jgi:hypothetical protein
MGRFETGSLFLIFLFPFNRNQFLICGSGGNGRPLAGEKPDSARQTGLADFVLILGRHPSAFGKRRRSYDKEL